MTIGEMTEAGKMIGGKLTSMRQEMKRMICAVSKGSRVEAKARGEH